MIKLRKAVKKDIEFLNQCINNEEYKKFISFENDIKQLNRRYLFIIQSKNTNCGFFELIDWDKINNNVSVNIYMCIKSSFINIVAMSEILKYLLKKLKFHKVIIKVKDNNFNMINIMKKLQIPLEGIIKNGLPGEKNEFRNIYIFRILEEDYKELHNKFEKYEEKKV